MPVHQLRGKAHGVGRHGGKAVLVDGARAGVRELHGEAKGLQQRFPEGHGVPVGKHARHADGYALAGRCRCAGPVLEQQLLALVVEVGHAVLRLLGGEHLLAHGGVLRVSYHFAAGAAVAGDPGRAVGKRDARAVAAVGAERADKVGFLLVVEVLHLVPADEAAGGARARARVPGYGLAAPRAAFRVPGFGILLRDERDADGSHQPGVGGTGNGAAHVLLEGAQHGVVQERAALHHDVVAQLVQVGNADHLGEDVLDDAAAQARHDVVGGLAVLLLGNDAAVHEHGAAAAQVGRCLGTEGGAGDFPGGDVQRAGEAFQERPASARTGLVHHHIGDNVAVDPDGLHVLPADVQDERGIGLEALCRMGVRHGFHLVHIGSQGAGEQHLAVAGGAAARHLKLAAGLGVARVQVAQGAHGNVHRLALVGGVERIHQVALFIEQGELGGGASTVHAQVYGELFG